MLTKNDVIGKWAKHVSPEHDRNIQRLVEACNALIKDMQADGVEFKINPLTKSIVSGETLGGFRPQNTPIGAPNSAHKQGLAVDVYDPQNKIDDWLYFNAPKLEKYGLWFEHKSATPYWSHWSIRQPKSGRRFFHP